MVPPDKVWFKFSTKDDSKEARIPVVSYLKTKELEDLVLGYFRNTQPKWADSPEQIKYLEKRIKELENENDHLRQETIRLSAELGPEVSSEADTSITRRYGGTGLGLSISYGIIRSHGGTLSFDSVEWEYTTVIVDLPTGDVPHGISDERGLWDE